MHQPKPSQFAHQPHSHQTTTIHFTPLLFCICLLMLGVVASSPAQAATVATDSSSYSTGSPVTILGSNYFRNESVHVVVTFANGTHLPPGNTDAWDVAATGTPPDAGDVINANGDPGDGGFLGFVTYWTIANGFAPGTSFAVTATGGTSQLVATTTFSLSNTKFHQLQNGTPANPQWSTGAINANNSCYAESQNVPYRFFMLNMSAGTTHTFKLTFEATKNSIHALDYLSQYDLTESGPIITVGGECSDTQAAAPDDCATPSVVAGLRDPRLLSSYVSAPPADIAGIISPSFPIDGPGSLYAYNATNVQVGQYSFGGTASNRELSVIITYRVSANGSVGFFWGGHLAIGETAGWGLGQGSGSISGAPFHMSAGEVDGSGGMPDLAVQNGVVCLPPDVTLSCSAGPYCTGATFTCSVPSGATNYTWTVTGATILTGQGTNSISYNVTASTGQTVTIHVYACKVIGGCYNQNCCSEASAQFTAADCCQVAITCPTNRTINCNESTNPSNTGTATYTTSGTCPLPITISYTDTETAGNCPQRKTISRLWKATDANGQVRAQCTQTINVVDNVAPVFSNCPGPVTVECSSIPAPATPNATDNCDPTPTITMTSSTTPGSCPQQYTLTRTWMATDHCGNSSTCSQVLTVRDTQPPTITCPQWISVQCLSNVPAPNTALVAATDNCDPNPIVTFVNDVSDGQTCPERITRTYRATDHCGNTATCTQLIIVNDTTPPQVTCPADITVQCVADIPAPNTALVSATDNCDTNPVIAWLRDEVSTTTCPKIITRTYKATDDCGNVGTCTQTITIHDTTPPVVTCPPNTTIQCGESSDPSHTGHATATDNCTPTGSIVITYSDTQNGSAITRTWTATDQCGNQASCQQTISTPPDLTPPQITCPGPVTVDCFESVPPPNPLLVTVFDLCDPSPVVVHVSDVQSGASCPYTITRTYRATDAAGNSSICTQTITIDDNTPPQLVGCPQNVTVQCDAIPAPASVGATDNCSGVTVAFNQTETPGSCPQAKIITRTWTATDFCGNQASCSQVVTVVDNTAPVISSCPAAISVQCAADVPAPNPALVTASDNCDPSPVVTFVSDVSNGQSCPETITRTYKARDACGNIAYCTQTITIDDTTAPQITCPGPVTVQCLSQVPQPNPALVTATDNCGQAPAVTFVSDVPSGQGCPITVTRTYKATDLCGNETFCQQIITVHDQTPPQVTCPGPVAVECVWQIPQPNPALVTATDNCGQAPVVTFVSDVPSGSGCPLIVTRTYKATDACGNETFCQQIITVRDETPPQITCPQPVTVNCIANIPAPDPNLVTANDNCGQVPVVTFVSDIRTGTGCPITVTRTYRAADVCGNEAFCTQIITVDDHQPPQLIGCPQNLTIDCSVGLPPAAIVTATDNCDGAVDVVFAEITTPGNCTYNYTVTRTWTATDACDNQASCEQVITVRDITAPQMTCPAPVSVECFTDVPQPNPALVTVLDNCDPHPVVSFVSDVRSQGSCPTYITRTYRAVDVCGNEVFCTQTITVDDNTPPVFTVFPSDQDIFQCLPTQICLNVAATDNCQGTVVLSVTNGPGSIVGGQWCVTPTATGAYDVTIRAADTCNNFVERTFHVSYRLNTRPTITNCPQDARIHWGQTYSVDIDATDPDAGQTLTYSLCQGAPEGVTINPSTGLVRFVTTVRDICDPEICVIAKDDCGVADTCRFEVCVYNDPPVITCPGDQVICYGYPFETQTTATDPDNSPYLFYYLASGPAGVHVDANTGNVTWSNPTPGSHEICVLATDSAATCNPCSPRNADTCCFTLKVVSLGLVIQKVPTQLQGQYTDVSIDFMNQGSNWPIAGYDLLIQYDASALSFQKAKAGKFFTDCAWEYFTYRFGASGNCGAGACPSGVLRIVAMAESSGGNLANHPDCYTNDGVANPGPGSTTSTQLAVMTFLVSNDRTLECQYVPIRFVWYDCGDNSLSNISGDTLYISHQVYDFAGTVGNPPVPQWNEITGLDNTMPTVTGAPSPECDISDKVELVRCANFHNGGIDIICADSIDAPGDINLNGISYEIADAVMLTGYFVNGLAAFGSHAEGSIAASDVNRDGITLSVADLVLLIRVIIGDCLPYAKGTPVTSVAAGYAVDDGVVSVSGDVDISGAALVVRGNVTPELLVNGMDMTYAYNDGVTRIIVTSPLDASTMHSFRGAFLGGLDGELVSIDLATSEGAPVVAKNVPSRYRLDQNYPNPFNPVTTIQFALPEAVDYRLTIYNIEGRVVNVFQGRAETPGVFKVDWNAGERASGVYLYRLDAGQFTQTRKMLLLK